MKMKRLPKIHLCCSTDELRPILNYVLLTKENVVATDAHIIIEYKTTELFEERFISDMPERCLIHKENWKILTQRHRHLFIKDSKIEIIFNSRNLFIPIETEGKNGKYPDYNTVFKLKSKEVKQIGLTPSFLNKLSMVMGVRKLDLYFNGETDAIIIKSSNENIKALIMPANVYE